MADDLERFRAALHGGPIMYVGLDCGGTLNSSDDDIDTALGMRPISPDAQDAIWRLDRIGVTLALVSDTLPGMDRRRALHAAGIDGCFGDRVYLSHELGINKAQPHFFTHVLNDLGIPAHELLICGNNIDTDVCTPATLGIPAVLLAPDADPSHLPPNTTVISRIGDLPDLLTGNPIRRG